MAKLTVPFTITIDGPSAAGKGTLARNLANALQIPYLDTGAIYRAVAVRVLDGADPIEAAKAFEATDIQRFKARLRTPETSQEASKVSAIPEVRKILDTFQIEFARQPGGAILDGRDTGTAIAPEARVKIFLTASDRVRAKRRFDELLEKDPSVEFDDVLKEMRERDERDRTRAASPTRPADDAWIFDTDNMTAEGLMSDVLAIALSTMLGTNDDQVNGTRENFLLVKNGYYYRPYARGYTASKAEAGRFTREDAEQRVASVEGLTMLPEDQAEPVSDIGVRGAIPKWTDEMVQEAQRRAFTRGFDKANEFRHLKRSPKADDVWNSEKGDLIEAPLP